MRQSPKSPKPNAKLPVAPTSRKNQSTRVLDLEKRLAEALGQLQTRNRELVEAREQQTAAAEILRVISTSPTDLQPVFDTIVRDAARVCAAFDAVVVLADGDDFVQRAHHGPIAAAVEARYALRGTVNGRAILESRVIQVEDLVEARDYPIGRDLAQRIGYRTMLSVPLLRDGAAIGAIGIRRTEVLAFSNEQIALLQTFADQAVIAIENVRLFNETKEALERQTATSEVLRVIAGSPTDLQPVLDALVESAGRLCQAADTFLLLVEGDQLRVAALHGAVDEGARLSNAIHRGWVAGRAVVDARTVHVEDLANAEAEFPLGAAIAARFGHRTALAMPLLRKGVPIGALFLRRREVRQFSDKEIALLETFADQAVIAIENVRLFRELEARNRDLTATGEILRVIASSPTDVQPVLNAVAESAAHLCEAPDVTIFLREPNALRVAARHGAIPSDSTLPLSRETGVGATVLEGQTVHVADMQTESGQFPVSFQNAQRLGFRTALNVPLMREGVAIGAISVRRTEAHLFTDQQVSLLEAFADQAVIAIENVRLFKELQASNRYLTTALDKQTATSDILRVISQSQTDVQPVFEAILSSAIRLMGAYAGVLTRVTGDSLDLAAFKSTDNAGESTVRAAFPLSLQSEGSHAKAVRGRTPVNIAEAQTDAQWPEAGRSIARAVGYQSMVVVPVLRHNVAVGTISAVRREPGGFSDDEIALLRTFADQAVIAIENVRLFTELEEKNRALTEAHAQVTEALEQQTATSEILRVISRSPTDTQPVFEIIARNAVRVCGSTACTVFVRDGDMVRVGATDFDNPQWAALMRSLYPAPISAELLPSQVIRECRIIHLADIEHNPRAVPATIRLSKAGGYRTVLSMPLVREGIALGAISVTRADTGPFSDSQIALLQTFADQAVIAIENVRLFTELQEKNSALIAAHAQASEALERQTATSEILQAISEAQTDAQTVFDAIARSTVRLCEAARSTVWRPEGELFRSVARCEMTPEGHVVSAPRGEALDADSLPGRAIRERQIVRVNDVPKNPTVPPKYRERARIRGYRSLMAVPMVREGLVVGVITVVRPASVEFSDQQVGLVKTFADQAVIAIENVRLFTELQARNRDIEDKSRQLEVASQHKSEFLANMSHELRTPLNAIIGFSEVLSERMFGELNEKQAEYLKDIYASGTHLLSLINDILDLSKIEAGRMELELTDFHLPTALDSALTLVRERAGRRGIALHLSVDERLGQVQADERKIRQVVLNLLSNAIKFTPEGGRIEVAAGPKDGCVEVSVSDTGVGIAPEDQEAVFEEFRQVGTAEKKAEGTGLGLTLCRKFIELHGGRIWVKSQVGVGSTFTFTIPVRGNEDNAE